jgi:hypothetical protein
MMSYFAALVSPLSYSRSPCRAQTLYEIRMERFVDQSPLLRILWRSSCVMPDSASSAVMATFMPFLIHHPADLSAVRPRSVWWPLLQRRY